jgi:hypothetical protein
LNAIGAALNSKSTARTLIGEVASEFSWFGEAEVPFPVILSSGFPTRNLWIARKVEWKSSSAHGVVATSERGTPPEALDRQIIGANGI